MALSATFIAVWVGRLSQIQRAQHDAVLAHDTALMAAVRTLDGDPTAQLSLLRQIENKNAPPPGASAEVKRLLGAPVAESVLIGHEQDVMSAVFSPDGARIASGSQDGTVRLWNADGSGAPITLGQHDQGALSVAFSPDGRRVASASYNSTVRVWSTDGASAPVVLLGHDGWVWSLDFSPDGTRIASASYDQTVRVWGADGSGVSLVLRGHDAAVLSVAFSPDGARIASGSQDGTVRLWVSARRTPDGRGGG